MGAETTGNAGLPRFAWTVSLAMSLEELFGSDLGKLRVPSRAAVAKESRSVARGSPNAEAAIRQFPAFPAVSFQNCYDRTGRVVHTAHQTLAVLRASRGAVLLPRPEFKPEAEQR